MIVKLSGWLQYNGAKRGERYADMELDAPYPHSTFITIYGDEGREGDDDLNEDLEPFWGPRVEIECSQDREGYLVSSPSRIALATAARERGDVKQAPAESPQSGPEGATPNPLKDRDHD